MLVLTTRYSNVPLYSCAKLMNTGADQFPPSYLIASWIFSNTILRYKARPAEGCNRNWP